LPGTVPVKSTDWPTVILAGLGTVVITQFCGGLAACAFDAIVSTMTPQTQAVIEIMFLKKRLEALIMSISLSSDPIG
jgi:hypothetical protein